MKWYKKQVDAILKAQKEEADSLDKKSSSGKINHNYPQDPIKKRGNSNYRSPVAESKLQRDKTDVH